MKNSLVRAKLFTATNASSFKQKQGFNAQKQKRKAIHRKDAEKRREFHLPFPMLLNVNIQLPAYKNPTFANMNRKLKLEELNRPDLDAFKSAEKNPVVVVLDNIRSFNNVGSIFRTADAFAIEKIVLCGITPAPPHRDIHKTALGATESVTWDYEKNTLDAVKKLKAEGYLIASIEQAENKVWLQDVRLVPNSKIALVFGHEVDGVEQEVIDMSDLVIEIPQYGTKHSINISVCAGIVMWEIVKKFS